MDILSLTSTETIRAILGVDDATLELPDQVFTDFGIEEAIKVDFLTWMPLPLADMRTQANTNETVKLALRACARYTGAILMVPSLIQARAIKQSDGQNEFQRQPFDPAALKIELAELLERYKALLLGALEIPIVAATTEFFGSVQPTFDPVTGV